MPKFTTPQLSWLTTLGKEADIVLASRVRLARNLKNLPFPNRANINDLAQIKEFPEFIQPNEWGYNWMRSRYVTDAILLYEASFDLILQIPWIFFQVYKTSNKDFDIRKDVANILENCRLGKFKNATSNSKLPYELYKLLANFYEKENITISKLANTIKHRQCISFKELRLQNVFTVIDKDYNSSLYKEYTLDGVIKTLREHHLKLVDLCERVQEFFPF